MTTVQKECKHHGLTEYFENNQGRLKCRQCNRDAVRRRRKKVKEELVEYKGGQCQLCGYNKCVEALEFHHLDPATKSFEIGDKMQRALKDLKAEADKCVIICSNCHKEVHAGLVYRLCLSLPS